MKTLKCFVCCFMLLLSGSPSAFSQDVGQQFEGFNLQGYTDGGQKAWDVTGDTADIFGNKIEITNVDANQYGDSQVNLKAQKGTVDKASGDVQLERDVVITSETGSQLKTDSLNWQKGKDLITTEDVVTLSDKGMVAVGKGLEAHPGLKTAIMNEDVAIDVNTEPENLDGEKVHITCDGPMEIDQKNNRAILNRNVVAVQEGRRLKADQIEILFDPELQKIKQMICSGHVEIIQGENVAYAERAVYNAETQKIVLSGQPKVMFTMADNGAEQEQDSP